MGTGIGFTLIIAALSSAPPAAPTCTTGADAAAELRAEHEKARRAHLTGDATLLGAGMADEMVVASNGDLLVNSRENMVAFFSGYLARVKYLEWSDVAPPMVTVSPDGRLGWMAVKVRARYLEPAKPEVGEKAFKSSWIATYKRVGCAWKMTGNASAVVPE